MPSSTPAPKPLVHAPAVEVIYGLQAVTPDDLDPQAVTDLVKDSLPEGFTIQQAVDHVNIAFKREGDGPIEHSHSQAWSGIKLLDTAGKTAAHLMRFGVFVNFLDYQDYDHAVPAVKAIWKVYRTAFRPLHVMRLSIRYINILKLPFENEKIKLERYFQLGLTFPESLSNNMKHFHYQFVFNADDTGMPARIMISSVKEEGDELHVAFDNEGYWEGQLPPDDPRIWHDFDDIRNWTYHIFNSILTEECAKIFSK